MSIYLIVYAILMINVFLSHGLREKGKKNLYVISCLVLLLLTILRSPNDTAWPDTRNYLNTFLRIRNIPWNKITSMGWEPGIVVLIKLISILGHSEQFYIIVLGVLILIPIFAMLWKSCEFPLLGLTIFYAMGNLTVTSIYRQWLAIAILTFSLKYVYERKPFKFLLVVLIATLFHRTAIIFVIVYFLYNLKISSNSLVMALIFSSGVYIAGNQIIQFLNRFARIPLEDSQNGGRTFLLVLWICVLVSYFINRSNRKEKDFVLPFNIVLIAATIQPLSIINSLLVRLVYYFSMYLTLLLPESIKKFEHSTDGNRRIGILLEMGFLILLLGWFCVGGIPRYIPMWVK